MNKLSTFCFGLILMFASACDKDDPNSGNGDGTPALPKISIENVTLFEGDDNSTFNFQVSLNATSEKEVKVDFATEEITAGVGEDFEHNSGTLSIAAGSRTATISVTILGNIYKEQDEQFKVVLSNPVNAEINRNEGLGTIRNDDTEVDVPSDGYITPENYTGWDLIWQDEFNGTEINTSDWTHEFGDHGWGNEELQNYGDNPKNSYIQNGNLIIEAHKESSGYSSARMITQGKKNFRWGRVDIRAILPEGQGIWPALWMLGEEIKNVGWPHCGEIDIMELVGHEPGKIHGTAHWGPQGNSWSYNEGQGKLLPGGEKYSEKYHVFSIIWEPGEINWYMDDNKYFTLKRDQVNGNYPFDNDFFFIFNVAVGGKWPGNPDATTTFPQQMIVDYVRVFQEK